MDIQDFQELDKELEGYVTTYNGIDVTYLLRNQLVSKIRTNSDKGNSKIILGKKVLLRFVYSNLQTFFNIFTKKDVWVFSNAERRKKIDGKYRDRVTSIVSEVCPSVLYIENPVLTKHKFPSSDKIYSDAALYFLSFLCAKLFFNKSRLKFSGDIKALEEKYKVRLSFLPAVQRFLGQYKAMSFVLKYLYKPRCVYMAYPNGYYGYVQAFKKNRIPIAELQHGIIYPGHPSYNYSVPGRAHLFRPDYIFTYGTRDKDCIIDLGYVEKANVHVVGSYGLWKTKQDTTPISNYMDDLIRGRENVLLITATKNDILELYDFAKKLMASNKELTLLLLPRHPVDLRDVGQNLRVLDVTKTDVFECYKVAHFHLTKASTCALEALYLDIPTFIFTSNGESLFKKNYAYIESFNYINSAEQLNDMLVSKAFTIPDRADISQVYADDVKGNFSAAIASMHL